MTIRRIRVRLWESEFETLARLAEESGRTFNDVMRDALRQHAEEYDSDESAQHMAPGFADPGSLRETRSRGLSYSTCRLCPFQRVTVFPCPRSVT
ncbi:ribbon-helix-helix domain-containing protein [Streptomyces sp. DT2A-34]|uniref:ribbon-helix-helix domain-containing protein n=2 Tax=Streptomyces sp. DT2A-34 TaxID=3051182 RepID=UPI003463AF22